MEKEKISAQDWDLFWFLPAVPWDWEMYGNSRISADKTAVPHLLYCI